jgi:hypothetical protein
MRSTRVSALAALAAVIFAAQWMTSCGNSGPGEPSVSTPPSSSSPSDTEVAAALPIASETTFGELVAALVEHEGLMWAADHRGGGLVALDPVDGTVVEEVPVEGSLVGLASAGGYLWTLDWTARELVRIDSQGKSTRSPLASDGGDFATIAGSLWFTGQDGRLKQLDPQSGKVVEDIATGKADAHGLDLTVGAGRVWQIRENDPHVYGIDPSSAVVTDVIDLRGTPSFVAFAEGRLWVTFGASREVAVIDVRSGEELRQLSFDDEPSSLASFGDSMWLRIGLDTVVQLDLETIEVVGRFTVPTDPYPGGAIVAAFDRLWLVATNQIIAFEGEESS